ncbi:hypothetical protein ACLBO9_14955, partial [Klebsiella pneumoniae]
MLYPDGSAGLAGRPLSTRTSLVLTVNHLTLSVRRQPLLREVAFSVYLLAAGGKENTSPDTAL